MSRSSHTARSCASRFTPWDVPALAQFPERDHRGEPSASSDVGQLFVGQRLRELPQSVAVLQSQPSLRRGAGGGCDLRGRRRSDLLASIEDFGNRLDRTAQNLGELDDGPTTLAQLVAEVLAHWERLGRPRIIYRNAHLSSSRDVVSWSVIVNDLDDDDRLAVIAGAEVQDQSALIIQEDKPQPPPPPSPLR